MKIPKEVCQRLLEALKNDKWEMYEGGGLFSYTQYLKSQSLEVGRRWQGSLIPTILLNKEELEFPLFWGHRVRKQIKKVIKQVYREREQAKLDKIEANWYGNKISTS